MKRLLLISNSTQHATGYLDHCADAIRAFLATTKTVLFVPYALFNHDEYARAAEKRFDALGYALSSIHTADNPVEAVLKAEAMFIGGGNTFRLLKTLYELKLISPIREKIEAGLPYIGTSAGVNMTCPTIRTTNDMPIVQPPSFDALKVIDFQINPHYLDADPGSSHMGETRETRLKEFHEENKYPVIGLREGTWLQIEGNEITLHGSRGARIFQSGQPPIEIEPGPVSQLT